MSLYLFNIWFTGLVRLTCVVFRSMAFPSVRSNKARLCIFIFFYMVVLLYLRYANILTQKMNSLGSWQSSKRCNEK